VRPNRDKWGEPKNVVRRTLDPCNELLAYTRTTLLDYGYDNAQLNYGDESPGSDLARLGKRVFAWIRRWTPHSVKVASGTFARRATAGAVAAASRGAKFH